MWDALRDLGALHPRLARVFVVDTRLEAGARLVTFGNGLEACELFVDLDDARRRFVWVADLLPESVGPTVEAMMSQGADVLKAAMEGGGAPKNRV